MALQSSARLIAVLEEAAERDRGDVAVIATDTSGTILYWNPQACSLYGWRPDETIGRNILDVTPTRSTADEASSIMEQLRRGVTWTGDFIVQRHDGTPIVVHVTDIPVRDESDVIGIVGLSHRNAASRATPLPQPAVRNTGA